MIRGQIQIMYKLLLTNMYNLNNFVFKKKDTLTAFYVYKLKVNKCNQPSKPKEIKE